MSEKIDTCICCDGILDYDKGIVILNKDCYNRMFDIASDPQQWQLCAENARLKALLGRCRSWVDAGTDLHKSIDAVLEGDEDGE